MSSFVIFPHCPCPQAEMMKLIRNRRCNGKIGKALNNQPLKYRAQVKIRESLNFVFLFSQLCKNGYCLCYLSLSSPPSLPLPLLTPLSPSPHPPLIPSPHPLSLPLLTPPLTPSPHPPLSLSPHPPSLSLPPRSGRQGREGTDAVQTAGHQDNGGLQV